MAEQPTEITIVTEYFHPDTAATGQLLTDLAVGLEERGLDVSVYTSQPNYHGNETDRWPRTDVYEGVQIRRSPVPQLAQDSMLKRAFNWTLFTLSAMLALLISRPGRDRQVLFVSNPPMLPLALWPVCRLRGWQYTYVVHDVYPDFLVESGFIDEGYVTRAWRALTRRSFLDAENVVALGPRMKELIVDIAGPSFDPRTVEIIHNWEDAEFIQPLEKTDNWFSEEHGLVDEFTLLYSGNIGYNHDLETVVRGMAHHDHDGTKLLVIGEGDRKADLVDIAEDIGVRGDRVAFLPYQPKSDLPYSLTAGDVSVVAVEAGMEGICVSSKLYTALAAGQPVLVVAEADDDEARIVTEADAGFQVDPGDHEGLAAALERWYEDPDLVERQGANARRTFERRFTKHEAVDAYYRLLNN